MFEKSPVAFLDELAKDVGGTERWWADQARAGKISARKVAGHWCLTREDLAEAMESFRSNAGPMLRPADDRGLTESTRPTDDRGLTETARRRTSA